MSYPFKLPDLPFDKAALEPHIDAQTMEIHHGKHHAAYVNNLNAALEKAPELQGWSLEELLGRITEVPESIRQAVINNGGGHHNHTLFWDILTPGGSQQPTGRLAEAIGAAFGSFDELKAKMTQAGATRFGSGWAWLVKDGEGKLQVYSTPNQDSPLMQGHTPLLGIDVWEHAYYLKYQNRRPDYLAAIWNVINWDKVAERL
ncbi:Superoxide dismutase [Mn] [Calidithermus terrae]|uniref:Superoxide dismutase n=1 Tax=Calidithermus terrae TaxID=1408545 RepID=A0A399F4F5_9DEIN|nr:superoxide dismutase [Calidithermus terrae]RIH90940.1 Superoxide dismutase [Mn] [Calidithermus terrae]